jgi:hypothetical protein
MPLRVVLHTQLALTADPIMQVFFDIRPRRSRCAYVSSQICTPRMQMSHSDKRGTCSLINMLTRFPCSCRIHNAPARSSKRGSKLGMTHLQMWRSTIEFQALTAMLPDRANQDVRRLPRQQSCCHIVSRSAAGRPFKCAAGLPSASEASRMRAATSRSWL